jgi:predicted nuclease with TOPRIM domain
MSAVYSLLAILVFFDIIFCVLFFRYFNNPVVDNLITQNSDLSKMLSELQKEIFLLNRDLERLAKENINLNTEVNNLSKEVERLQTQMYESQE